MMYATKSLSLHEPHAGLKDYSIGSFLDENPDFSWQAWAGLVMLLGFGSFVISAFQLVFAEALVSIGLKLQRAFQWLIR